MEKKIGKEAIPFDQNASRHSEKQSGNNWSC